MKKGTAFAAVGPERAGRSRSGVVHRGWDISGIEEWPPQRHELGATIPEAGNSFQNETGGWRSLIPVLEAEKCTACTLCYFFCPDASILLEGARAVGIDLAHCKGCGICARECEAGAIRMVSEEKD